MLENIIGIKLAHFRALKDYTQNTLADKSGVSKIYISHIETGRKIPSFKISVKLAKALGVDWREFVIPPAIEKINNLNISEDSKITIISSIINAEKFLNNS